MSMQYQVVFVILFHLFMAAGTKQRFIPHYRASELMWQFGALRLNI